jgi:hypothetical protein
MSLFIDKENNDSKITIPENKQIHTKYMNISINNTDIIVFFS